MIKTNNLLSHLASIKDHLQKETMQEATQETKMKISYIITIIEMIKL